MLPEQEESQSWILTLFYFHLPINIHIYFTNSVIYHEHNNGRLFSQQEKLTLVSLALGFVTQIQNWDRTHMVV